MKENKQQTTNRQTGRVKITTLDTRKLECSHAQSACNKHSLGCRSMAEYCTAQHSATKHDTMRASSEASSHSWMQFVTSESPSNYVIAVVVLLFIVGVTNRTLS